MTALAEVQWGRTRIAYTLSRSARQKTLSIRVEPDGSVEVVAPASVTPDRVASLVHKKAAWIVERQRRVADVPTYVMPNTSGLNARSTVATLAADLLAAHGEVPARRSSDQP